MIPESRDRPPECSRSSAASAPYHLQARPAHLVASGIAPRLPDARTRQDLLPRRREGSRSGPDPVAASGRGGRRRVRAKGRFRPATVRSSRAGGCRRRGGSPASARLGRTTPGAAPGLRPRRGDGTPRPAHRRWLSRQARFSTRTGSWPPRSRASACWICRGSCRGRSARCCWPTSGWMCSRSTHRPTRWAWASRCSGGTSGASRST